MAPQIMVTCWNLAKDVESEGSGIQRCFSQDLNEVLSVATPKDILVIIATGGGNQNVQF